MKTSLRWPIVMVRTQVVLFVTILMLLSERHRRPAPMTLGPGSCGENEFFGFRYADETREGLSSTCSLV